MTGLLGLTLPPWLNPSVLALVGTGLIASAGGAYVAHRWDAGTIAESRLETAKARADYRAYEALTASNAATATELALSQQTALQGTIDGLQAKLQESQRIADAKSKALQALLASAKPGDLRALGPVASEYVSRLLGP